MGTGHDLGDPLLVRGRVAVPGGRQREALLASVAEPEDGLGALDLDGLDADPLDLLGTVLARSVSEEGSNITPLPRIVSRQHHAGLGAVAETSYTELNEDDYTP